MPGPGRGAESVLGPGGVVFLTDVPKPLQALLPDRCWLCAICAPWQNPERKVDLRSQVWDRVMSVVTFISKTGNGSQRGSG